MTSTIGETQERLRYAKIVLYGREGAGKSALMMRYVYGKFDNCLESTVGAAFNSKRVIVDGSTVILQIWDTAGSERFNSIAPIYIRGAVVVLLCFDEPVVSEIETRLEKVLEYAPDAEIFLVATKIDEPKISYQDIIDYATKHSYRLFYTSALTGSGIENLFDNVSRETLEVKEEVKTIRLSLHTEDYIEKRRCCGSGQ